VRKIRGAPVQIGCHAKNLRLDPLGGETSTPIIKSRLDPNESGIDSNDGETKEYHRMPVFHASDIVGLPTFEYTFYDLRIVGMIRSLSSTERKAVR
jgi:hypothetical protein